MVQKTVGCTYSQNEFLFKHTATNIRFWVVCGKMKCVLVLNALRFDAKRKVKWCKMQCVLLQNAR